VVKTNQKGIAQILILLILIGGLVGGLYLVRQTQIFKPRAQTPRPIPIGETSFTLSTDSNGLSAGQKFSVDLLVRTDVDAANLFVAKINFPKDLLEVTGIEKIFVPPDLPPPGMVPEVTLKLGESTSSSVPKPPGIEVVGQTVPDYFIKNWVESYFNNQDGVISLVGGVPTPGVQTNAGATYAPKMATINFIVKAEGEATISFDEKSAIYRNSDNIDILQIKRDLSFNIGCSSAVIDCAVPPAGCSYVGGTCQSCGTLSCTPICAAVITSAINSITGECREFPSPCDVPEGWEVATNCTLQPTITPVPTPPVCPLWERICKPANICQSYWVPCDPVLTPTPSPTCQPRPACLDATPVCLIPEPAGGWCLPGECSGAFPRCEGGKDAIQISPDPDGCPKYICPTSYQKGDGNRDGKIDLIDLSVLLSNFNKSISIPELDANDDGVINVFDFSALVRIFIANGIVKQVN